MTAEDLIMADDPYSCIPWAETTITSWP